MLDRIDKYMDKTLYWIVLTCGSVFAMTGVALVYALTQIGFVGYFLAAILIALFFYWGYKIREGGVES